MWTVAAFYHFAPLDAPLAVRDALDRAGADLGLRGIILVAGEGINGTIAGAAVAIAGMEAVLRALPGCADLEWKESHAAEMPFGRLRVRVKREIVTMGREGVDPRAKVGRHVAAADWNALIAAPDVVVIDTRNDYEVALGTFEGAVDPGTRSFREFPDWWAANADRFAGKRVAMFCTGGIRCEKATNFVIGQGVAEVFHLKGGILRYLEEVPQDQSLWRGGCFVFDGRVSLGHGLAAQDATICHACRRPVVPADRAHPGYEEGVSCPACVDEIPDARRARFRERERQIRLARARGAAHLGHGPKNPEN